MPVSRRAGLEQGNMAQQSVEGAKKRVNDIGPFLPPILTSSTIRFPISVRQAPFAL